MIDVRQDAKKIRVIHVCSLGTVPKWFLLEHFRNMRREGFEVILICCDDENARDSAETTGIRFIPVTINQPITVIADIISLLRLWRKLCQLRPTIVDSHMSKPGLIGSLAAWLARVPIRIYHNHGMALLSSHGWKYWLLRLTESIACWCATEVIFVAPSNRDDAIKVGICSAKKAVVLGPGTICGVDTNRFNPEVAAPRGIQLRQRAGIPQKAWLVGFVGRIIPHKGVETILEAWRLLPQEIRAHAFLCFFGAFESHHPQMKALVEHAILDVQFHVKYMGFSDDLPAWYSTMTLLVQPSWHEGWGYNVLEAACSGVTAIGTRISATIDAILDDKTGLLVPVKDPEAMAKAIVKLLKDDRLRARLGQAARERAINSFSQDKICPLLVHEYRRLLAELES
jgi:glycosyltransferase involved in cell wall biosynthesis